MKRLIIVYVLILCIGSLFSQRDEKKYSAELSAQIDSAAVQQYRRVEPIFREAYQLYPSVPRGVLEAVSYTYTRFSHLSLVDNQEDEGSVPNTYGLMGLTLDGRGFFRDNLRYVSELSSFAVDDMVKSPRDNVVAYAAAYAALQRQLGIHSNCFDAQIPILTALSELPLSDDPGLSFALNSSLYAIARFVDNDLFRSAVGATLEKPDYVRCFGPMLPRLCSPEVQLPVGTGRSARSGDTDYDGAIWNPAGTCNYTPGRGGYAISAVTIHYTQGTYAGSIAWFQNCTYNGVGARASAHYVVRSIDGQVTQMVREADKAWHVGNCNPYTIGIEHEAYGDIASYFTPEMYHSSARLVRDICDRNGIPPHRMFYRDTLDDGTVLNDGLHSLGGESACIKIRGHQHFPNQSHTDPGPYWNWNYYYKLVNDDTPVTRFDAPSGTLTDSGGADGDYGNDERQLLLIQVDGVRSITLSFRDFNLEDNYDFLWIYDGSTVYAPPLGRWNTTSPGTVTSSGNALLLEFRSDCATTAAGWVATWQADVPDTSQPPVTKVLWDEDEWVTDDFALRFEDTADGEIPYRFYQVAGHNGRQWTANPNRGFAYDDFDRLDTRLWSVDRGNWQCSHGRLIQMGAESAEIVLPLTVNAGDTYLYEFDLTLSRGEGAGRAAGIRIAIPGSSVQQISYSVAVCPEENKLKVYQLSQTNQQLLLTVDGVVTCPDVLYRYQIVHSLPTGRIMLFREGHLLGEVMAAARTMALYRNSRMSFFTSGTDASFDNLRIYRSRGTSVGVTVGSDRDCDIQWQSVNGAPTVRVRSVIVDDHWAFSQVDEKDILVDFTAPALRAPVSVGRSESVEASPTAATYIHWSPASEPHSGIAYYEYGVVQTPDADEEEVQWCGRTDRTGVSVRPIPRLLEPCCFVVRAVNGAGLKSSPIFSELYPVSTLVGRVSERSLKGCVTEVRGKGSQDAATTEGLRLWPNPVTDVLNVVPPEPLVSLDVFDACGQRVHRVDSTEPCVGVSSLKTGIYFLRVVGRSGKVYSAPFLKKP